MCRACKDSGKFVLFTSIIPCPYCVTGEAVLGKPPASLADEFKLPEPKSEEPKPEIPDVPF